MSTEELKDYLIAQSHDHEEPLDARSRATLSLLVIPSDIQKLMGADVLKALIDSVAMAVEAAELGASMRNRNVERTQ